MPITESELEALTNYIITLEGQCDFLTRENEMYKNGPQAAHELAKAALQPCPPGMARGSAGQLVLADHELIYEELWGHLPKRAPRKRARKPDGDEIR